MPAYQIYLHIPKHELMRYYRGDVSKVIANTVDGTRVQFPASRLREFAGHDGVNGLFQLTVDDDHRMLSIERLS